MAKKPAKKKAAAKPAAKPAANDIEAAADAAAASEPAADPTPDPEPDPPADYDADDRDDKVEGAPATERTPQTSKPDAEPSANQDHLAAKKESRVLAEPAEPAELSDEAKAKIELRKETRARLDEIAAELAEIEDAKRELIDEQQELANPVTQPDGMSFIERLRQVQARTQENRERRVRDRLTLLAIGAGKSPLDQAMGGGKRKSLADADAKAADDKKE